MTAKYCPICQRNIEPSNKEEVDKVLHDGYIYVNDDIVHTDDYIEALDNCVQQRGV